MTPESKRSQGRSDKAQRRNDRSQGQVDRSQGRMDAKPQKRGSSVQVASSNSRVTTARKPVGMTPLLARTVTTGVRRRPVSVTDNVDQKTENVNRRELTRNVQSIHRDAGPDILAQLNSWEDKDKKERKLSEEQGRI